MVKAASPFDQNTAFLLMDSLGEHEHVMIDATYDSSDINDYEFKSTKSFLVIDPKREEE